MKEFFYAMDAILWPWNLYFFSMVIPMWDKRMQNRRENRKPHEWYLCNPCTKERRTFYLAVKENNQLERVVLNPSERYRFFGRVDYLLVMVDGRAIEVFGFLNKDLLAWFRRA